MKRSLLLALPSCLLLGGVPTALGQGLDVAEPMVFDLVRGLDPAAGEFEANALFLFSPTDPDELVWAPEVEWAVARGLALEAELGFVNTDLHSVKGAAQLSWPVREGGAVGHGVQFLTEYEIEHDELVLNATYLVGVRFAPRWSILSMVGPALAVPFGTGVTVPEVDPRGGPVDDQVDAGSVTAGAIVNATLFFDLSEHWVLGCEQNLALFDWEPFVRVMPQAHWSVTEHFGWQLGAGATYASLAEQQWNLELGTRLVAEF